MYHNNNKGGGKGYLVVGLGNIGEVYEGTRHNIGFRIVDHLANSYGARFVTKPLGAIASIDYRGRRVWLLKPTTYMNESGRAVRSWLKRLSLPIERLVVVNDDLHLSFGEMRLKPKGGSGGHNGLKSISEQLQTTDYARLRFGIGNNFARGRQADFVLGHFTIQEQASLTLHIFKASEMLLDLCLLGIGMAGNKHNKRKRT